MVAGRGTIFRPPELPGQFGHSETFHSKHRQPPLDHFGYLLCKDKKPLGEDHISTYALL
jgi:hypothetical protein